MEFQGAIENVIIHEEDGGMHVSFAGSSAVPVDLSFGDTGENPVIDFGTGLTVEYLNGEWIVFVNGTEYNFPDADETDDPVGDGSTDEEVNVVEPVALAPQGGPENPTFLKAPPLSSVAWPGANPIPPVAPALSPGNGVNSTPPVTNPPPLTRGR